MTSVRFKPAGCRRRSRPQSCPSSADFYGSTDLENDTTSAKEEFAWYIDSEHRLEVMGSMMSNISSSDGGSSVIAHEKILPEKLDLSVNEGVTIKEDLWRQSLQNKLDQAQSTKYLFRQHLSAETTFDSSLQTLTELYYQHGFISRIPQVTAILTGIKPFAAAITTIVQVHPEAAGLVWGSVSMVLQVLLGSSNKLT